MRDGVVGRKVWFELDSSFWAMRRLMVMVCRYGLFVTDRSLDRMRMDVLILLVPCSEPLMVLKRHLLLIPLRWWILAAS